MATERTSTGRCDGLGEVGASVSPRLWVPAVSVERYRQVQVLGHERLLERHRVDLAVGGQRLGQPDVPGGQVQRLGLGLAVTRGQVDAAVAARDDLGFELGQQHPRVAPAPMPAVGPDALELGGVGVEPAERAAGDGLAVEQPDRAAPPLGGANSSAG